jgi:mannose-6-phosphate isomerase-like protein (cupin superfamily)
MPKKVEKVWGFEEWWVNDDEYCFKVLVLKPGYTSSLHYHPIKKETFIVLRGHCQILVKHGDTELRRQMDTEQQITIYPGTPHQFWLEKEASGPCIIYEVSTHHDDDDVVRQSESGLVV